MSPEETKALIVRGLKAKPPVATELRGALVMALQLLRSSSPDAFTRAFVEDCEALLSRTQ